MDRDHAALDVLFDAVTTAADSGLCALLYTISEEIREHFAREEAGMIEAGVPNLLRHLELHAQLLREVEIENMRREIQESDPDTARRLIGTLLPQLLADHAATADAASARLLTSGNGQPASAEPHVVRFGRARA
jgi:hemerythrin-like metal-binding protein